MNDRSQSQCAVCFAASSGYVYQTIIAALTTRVNVRSDIRVFILALDWSEDEWLAAESSTSGSGIELMPVALGDIRGLSPTYARLFMDIYLPAEIDRIVYLDGDVQVVGDIEDLFAFDIPAGGILAALDPMVPGARASRTIGVRTRAAWDSSEIPIEVRNRYFNTGMFALARRDLPDIRQRAMRVLLDNNSSFAFKDQDVLNLVVHKVRLVSLEYNFPAFLLRTPAAKINPRILHFMSNPRPWEGPYYPWGWTAYRVYGTYRREHPALNALSSRVPFTTVFKYWLLQIKKRLLEGPVWRSTTFVTAINEYQRSVSVASQNRRCR